MFKLVTFDIYETLLKTRKPLGEMYTQAGKSFGIHGVNPDVVAANFKSQWINMWTTHPNFGLHSGLGWEAWWKNIVRCTFKNSTNENINEEKLDQVGLYLIELFSTKEGWSCEDGALDLLHYLASCKVHMGVISNFDPRLHSILKELKLSDYFSFILTSYETSYLKPDINIFKIAQRTYENQSGLKLEETSALHIGNSVELDVKGASNAGWNAALISNELNSGSHKNGKRVMFFKNLSDLNKYFVSRLN
uniref:Putative haloacid dehalogenase-like hydrolase n=1 Tax=Triatoma infestans TaxID=30076 RepID=A0A023F7B5_TRIIF